MWEQNFNDLKGIPSYFFLFLKKIVHDPKKNKSYYLTALKKTFENLPIIKIKEVE